MTNTAKIALVTGAGSGIGKSTAIALSQVGYAVVLTGRNIEKLNHVADLCQTDTLTIKCDVSSPSEVEHLFQATEERFGRLDLLFNNAGTGAFSTPIDELPVEQWLNVVNVNLTGVFLCARAAVKLMKKQQPMGGRIINNGSISAHTPRPNSTPYTATKHGVTGITRCISLDGRAFNIACGQIDIGNADTDMAAAFQQGVPQADGSIKSEPTMDVQLVADAVVNMAQLPLSANVQFMTIMASGMPYIGRG